MRDAVGSLGGGFLLAAVLVYLILVVQFRSLLLPCNHDDDGSHGDGGRDCLFWRCGIPTLQHSSGDRAASLSSGSAVPHGVLSLVEYIIERTHIDPTVDEAIINGAKARLRPIAMTSLASILGLLPMALGWGRGSEANIPLGRAVIGGQIMSTLLNFYLVPFGASS